jgi:hypothetical protein
MASLWTIEVQPARDPALSGQHGEIIKAFDKWWGDISIAKLILSVSFILSLTYSVQPLWFKLCGCPLCFASPGFTGITAA